jgi:flagellar protein FlbD
MIRITRLNHTPLILNSDLIEHIEVTPDTVIALTSGQKYMVLETTEEIIERVVRFRQSLVRNQPVQSMSTSGATPAVSIAMGEPPSNG